MVSDAQVRLLRRKLMQKKKTTRTAAAAAAGMATRTAQKWLNGPLPSEKEKVTHPAYVIEPPDILFIDAIRVVPKPPYRIEPLDILLIQVAETLPNDRQKT